MKKIIPISIIFKYKINKQQWRQNKIMAEISIAIKAKITRISRAYTFFYIAWKSLILGMRQLFE